jgi:hypothetical protein
MYRGSGNYVIQSFGLREPPGEPPSGLEGGTRIPYGEVSAQLARRGLRAEPFSWGLLRPGESQSVPLSLEGGRCYSVAALATPDFAGADLDLSLINSDGVVDAAEIGPNPHPMVFHCPERDGVVRAVVRAHDLRAPGRFLLVVGTDAPAQSSQEDS